MGKVSQKFERWVDLLEAIMREKEFESPVDEDLLQNYYREGYSPQEFFDEVVAGEREADDFDIRYDL